MTAVLIAIAGFGPIGATAADRVGGPPLLTVNGELVPATTHPPALRGDAWYVPAAPIAEALLSSLEFDSGTQVVRVVNSFDGVEVEYSGRTGQGLRDHAFSISLAPGLPVGTSRDDLMLPLSLVAALFDVETWVSPEETEISLISRRGASPLAAAGLPVVGLQDLSYQGWAHRWAGRAAAGLSLESGSRVHGGSLRSHVSTRADEGTGAEVRAFGATFDDGRGNAWSGGDLRGAPDFRWLHAFGRGLRWDAERRGGRRRWAAGWVRLSEGRGGVHGDLGGPSFAGDVMTFSYTTGARGGAPAGQATSVGTSVSRGRPDGGDGVLVAAHHRAGWSRLGVQGMAGFFGSAEDDLRHRLAGEISVDARPHPKWRLDARAGRYERDFRLPTSVFSERNSRFVTVGSSVQPRRWLALSAAQSAHDHRRPDGRWEHLAHESISVQPPRGPFRSSTLILGQRVGLAAGESSDLQWDNRGRTRWGEWYLSSRRRLDVEAPWSTSIGSSFHFGRGAGHLAGTWVGGSFDGVSVQANRSFLKASRLEAGLGLAWTRTTFAGSDPLRGSLRLSYRFGGPHVAELSIDEQSTATVARTSWRGRFRFAEGRPEGFHPGVRSPAHRHVSRIEGRVFLDRNLDGRYDDGDRALSETTVLLDGGRLRTVTDETGTYVFANVRAGVHRIGVRPETIRADLSLLDEMEREILVPAFRTATVVFRTAVNRSLSGVVFLDRNRDGVRDAAEPGIPEIHVVIPGCGDTITDAQGRWRIGDLTPGRHELVIDRRSLTRDEVAPSPRAIDVPNDRDPQPLDVAVEPEVRAVRRKVFSAAG